MDRSMLQNIAYELYKQNWIDCHTTEKERIQSMREYYEEFLNGEAAEVYETYEEYLWERGFDGQIYACFDEFVECEYRNEKYMRHLLGDTIYEFFKEEKEFEER